MAAAAPLLPMPPDPAEELDDSVLVIEDDAAVDSILTEKQERRHLVQVTDLAEDRGARNRADPVAPHPAA